MCRKQQPREDLLHDRIDRFEGHAGVAIDPLLLEERIGDRRQHHVTIPAEVGAALEVIEAQFGFQLLILLLDRPGADESGKTSPRTADSVIGERSEGTRLLGLLSGIRATSRAAVAR
jgi:hypothetical protein